DRPLGPPSDRNVAASSGNVEQWITCADTRPLASGWSTSRARAPLMSISWSVGDEARVAAAGGRHRRHPPLRPHRLPVPDVRAGRTHAMAGNPLGDLAGRNVGLGPADSSLVVVDLRRGSGAALLVRLRVAGGSPVGLATLRRQTTSTPLSCISSSASAP